MGIALCQCFRAATTASMLGAAVLWAKFLLDSEIRQDDHLNILIDFMP